ncbi:hypothetical protein EVAR_83652_1 [Eumeta japonica]|uniref:Uncharacterized protein n=1 Tax=Eumeta variegata TaxID=151549 RepID=A0A4C1UNJ8_EUMVA|nr:hypothetical protein EVAR_83652_1 [Eumeta japonica]
MAANNGVQIAAARTRLRGRRRRRPLFRRGARTAVGSRTGECDRRMRDPLPKRNGQSDRRAYQTRTMTPPAPHRDRNRETDIILTSSSPSRLTGNFIRTEARVEAGTESRTGPKLGFRSRCKRDGIRNRDDGNVTDVPRMLFTSTTGDKVCGSGPAPRTPHARVRSRAKTLPVYT